MRDTDAAWLAGFLEGEGSFMVTRAERDGNVYYAAVVSATNTDRALVQRCMDIAGGRVQVVHMNRANARWKNAYHWRVKDANVAAIIEAVMPYLVSKRPQAELLLELRRNTWKGSKPGRFGTVKTPEERALRERIHAEVKELNRRGHVISANNGASETSLLRAISQ